jgi:hypothetical protein
MPSGEPWITLRAVVEVKVPPRTPATDKDLIAYLQQHLKNPIPLPRAAHPRHKLGIARVKSFAKFWPPLARSLGWRKPATVRVPLDEM